MCSWNLSTGPELCSILSLMCFALPMYLRCGVPQKYTKVVSPGLLEIPEVFHSKLMRGRNPDTLSTLEVVEEGREDGFRAPSCLPKKYTRVLNRVLKVFSCLRKTWRSECGRPNIIFLLRDEEGKSHISRVLLHTASVVAVRASGGWLTLHR